MKHGFQVCGGVGRRARHRYLFLIMASVYSLSSGAQSGYANLVRRIAPSVVTVLVEERSQGAAQHARRPGRGEDG